MEPRAYASSLYRDGAFYFVDLSRGWRLHREQPEARYPAGGSSRGLWMRVRPKRKSTDDFLISINSEI
ncbi:MAG: hypothetical protein GX072_14165 [Lysinibacillus sp.]|nr:hypothetical protein [Lysinibacillus sp.]